MFIDTHAHFYDSNPDEVIANAAAANVGIIVAASAHPDDLEKNTALCEKYENIFCTIGIHPEYANQRSDFRFQISDKVIGIGEIGLDYHYENNPPRDAQIELFLRQLEIAQNAGLPVAVHTRDAEQDTINILGDHSGHGVLHCFTGTWNLAKTMLDRGWFVSASGIISFKNSDDLRDTFARIPTDRIVIETDSPFCAPVPYRGKQCQPFMAAEVAKCMAQIKNIPLPEMEIILEENTKRLYPKLCRN
ncbi:MAG: TatD family hydrolase [Rickettsiales bacterium]|jgi:TatD DNase family protein|nr:TatD family hydrolase [Rickettsiales bacterium]